MNSELNRYDDEVKCTVLPSVLDATDDKVMNSEHLANGKSSPDSDTTENDVNKEPIERKSTMNTNNDYLFSVTKTDSDTLIISQHINGENEQILNLHQGNIEIKQTDEIMSNNNHVNAEPVHDTNNESQETDVMSGTEINNGSDEESCQYVDDATEDPISTIGSQEPGRKVGSFEIVAINRYHSSDENSSDGSGSEEDLIVGDTVSLTSDSENSKDNEVIIIDNELTHKRNRNSKITEIHEIGSDISDNDDCVLTAVEKVHKVPKKMQIAKPVLRSELRRSSRTIKRKTYSETDELQDKSEDIIKEVILGDGEIPSTWKIIDEFPTPTKQSKLENITKFSESKTDLVINENNYSTLSNNNFPANPESSLPAIESASSVVNHKRSESIASQDICVNTKNVETKTVATQATELSPASILPTLTDDMFVVEAPSFIVPYVYEKPPIVPFKDFVDKWGNEIKEEEVKVEKEALEKKKAEKKKRQQERKLKRDNGEEVEESEEELTPEEIEKKKAQKAARKERRRRKKEEDEDDLSWDGSSSEESDDSLSEDDSQSAVIDKASLINDLSTVSKTVNPDNYFSLSLGKFFINIGTNLVQEFVQTDLLHQEKRKLIRENRAGRDTKKRKKSIAQLTKNLEHTQAANALYKYEYKKCGNCDFKSESSVVLANHIQTPNLCKKIIGGKISKNILNIDSQIEKTHGNKGNLDCEPAPYQCPNCPFEDQTNKSKVARHVVTCARKFKTETNLAPPVEWDHPAKIAKPGRARAPVPYRVVRFDQNQMDASRAFRPRISIANTASTPPLKPRVPTPAVQLPVPVRTSGLTIRPVPASTALNAGVFKKQVNHSYIISTAPQQTGPIQPINAANAKGVVMCEICDGYIKDLEQLRNHMQWIHKIKIHPKMIYNRPPLNCQKCQFRFFTDQGLERHLLGSHGLVTSAIQEAANKGKDAGRCPVCGRAYQRKLLAHISRDHNVVLKPAHLSYKCTVCSSTFGMYRQFESHVYSVHSVVAKKAIDKKSATAKASESDSVTKQLKIGDGVSIAPVPVKNTDSAKD